MTSLAMPTVDDIVQKMEGASVFSEVDQSQGYLQVLFRHNSPIMLEHLQL